MTGSRRARLVALTGSCAAAAYLVSLGPPWAVDGAEGMSFFPLIARSSAVNAFGSVTYLVAVPATLGFSAATVLAPPSKGGWYVLGARAAALLGLGGVAGVAYRLEHADLSFGAGWYVALLAVAAAAVAALLSATGRRREAGTPEAGERDASGARGPGIKMVDRDGPGTLGCRDRPADTPGAP